MQRAAGRLDPYHLRAQAGEQLRPVRGGVVDQVKGADAGEGTYGAVTSDIAVRDHRISGLLSVIGRAYRAVGRRQS